MDCTLITKQEFAERYALGKLGPEQCDAYERHYFECERCFNELQQLLVIRRELEAQALNAPAPQRDFGWRSTWWWPALASAAAIVVVVMLGYWREAPAPLPGPDPGATRAMALAELSRIDPPIYEAPVLRGVHDTASTAFRAGMKDYLAGDFNAAALRLREAAAADSSRPDIAFYLGAAELLADRPDAARAEFERLIGLGDTPFSEEAHFYLGKALLRQGRLSQARLEFQLVADKKGLLQAEAKALLEALQQLDPSPSTR
jgi:tetratricopeptide (TPR) repeat protein